MYKRQRRDGVHRVRVDGPDTVQLGRDLAGLAVDGVRVAGHRAVAARAVEHQVGVERGVQPQAVVAPEGRTGGGLAAVPQLLGHLAPQHLRAVQ